MGLIKVYPFYCVLNPLCLFWKDDGKPVLQQSISRISVSEDNPNAEKEQVLEAEERAKGNLKWAVIQHYIQSVRSWPVVMGAIFCLLLTQAGATFSDYWLSYWYVKLTKRPVVAQRLKV